MNQHRQTAQHSASSAAYEASSSPRQRLLDGLAQSVREKGLQHTKISDIVRNARTSKRTFYECFADKEACLTELAEEWAAEMRQAVATGVDPTAPWDVQIDMAVDSFLAAVKRDPVLVVAISRELPALGEQHFALWERDIEFYAAFYMDLSQGPMMRRAGVQPLSWERAIMLVGGLSELIDRVLRTDGSLDTAGDEMKDVMKLLIGPR